MQKHVLFIFMLSIISAYAMELSHESPEITCIHSQQYLQLLEKCMDIGRINPCDLKGCTPKNLARELKDVSYTLQATHDIIKAKKNSIKQPHYSMSRAESNTFAGNQKTLNNWSDEHYATIPVAAAEALKTNLFKHILIIDEYLDPDTQKEYYKYGNGSLFYPKNNLELSALFDGKIITYDKIQNKTLWHFLNTEGKDIDLVFYSIDTEDDSNQTDLRKPNIFSLFQKLIPTVFILSGHPCKDNQIDHIFQYIAKTAHKISKFFFPKNNKNIESKISDTSSSEDVSDNASPKTILSGDFTDFSSSSDDTDDQNNESSSDDNSDSYDLDPFVFKITTDMQETKKHVGANYTLLAEEIIITDDGTMEVTLHEDYGFYSQYQRYTNSTVNSSPSSDNEEQIYIPISVTETKPTFSTQQRIIGSVDTQNDTFIILLAETVPDIPLIQLSQEDLLSHKSRLITMMHSEHYLEDIKKNQNSMLNNVSLDEMLKHCAETILATKLLLQNKKNCTSNYTISLGEGYSFAGHTQSNHDHIYAAIPIAANYALNTETIGRILIIDENLNKDQTFIDDYYNYGNGSIFYSQDNQQLFDLFNDKIITHDKIPNRNIWEFLNQPDHNIDLVFYNINIEDTGITTHKRNLNIVSLIDKFIPTVFIFSGDKNNHAHTACALVQYIADMTENYIPLAYRTELKKFFTTLPLSSSYSENDSTNDDDTKVDEISSNTEPNTNDHNNSSEPTIIPEFTDTKKNEPSIENNDDDTNVDEISSNTEPNTNDHNNSSEPTVIPEFTDTKKNEPCIENSEIVDPQKPKITNPSKGIQKLYDSLKNVMAMLCSPRQYITKKVLFTTFAAAIFIGMTTYIVKTGFVYSN